MNYKYHVEVLEIKEVHDIPHIWEKTQFLRLMELVEYDDVATIPDNELKEMTAMALSDLEPEEAAQKVLELRLGDNLTKGQRQNLAEELKGDKLWEEYPEIDFHKEIFNVSVMLNWAFPKEFPLPDIVCIKLKVTAQNSPSLENLQNPTASFIARLLNDGMNEHNAIFRLFDGNIASDSFEEANHIIWEFHSGGFNSLDKSAELTIYTAWNWVDELKGVGEFNSTAYSDGQKD